MLKCTREVVSGQGWRSVERPNSSLPERTGLPSMQGQEVGVTEAYGHRNGPRRMASSAELECELGRPLDGFRAKSQPAEPAYLYPVSPVMSGVVSTNGGAHTQDGADRRGGITRKCTSVRCDLSRALLVPCIPASRSPTRGINTSRLCSSR